MTLPRFEPGADPGPDFAELLRRAGSPAPRRSLSGAGWGQPFGHGQGDGMAIDPPLAGPAAGGLRHGTTCLALRYADGVVMAGDRRATAGNFISHHRIEKVFPADSHSGVAVAGAAGPAAELVRLFQLQLEHYEKVEGTAISLEGKANQLSHMVRGNLPAALQGLVVVPVFAGYDLAEGTGRLFEFDIAGGRYEERDYASTGSGTMHATTVMKLGFRPAMSRRQAVLLVLEALAVAAESDAATGGPDMLREIFPVVAVVDSSGYRRLDNAEVKALAAEVAAGMVERLSGTATP